MANNTNKPLEAEVFNASNISIKRGLVRRLTTLGAFVYDPKPPKNEPPDAAEWFPYKAPNGLRTVVFGGE